MVKSSTAFWDYTERKAVHYWVDCYFDKYLASSRWGYRIKLK